MTRLLDALEAAFWIGIGYYACLTAADVLVGHFHERAGIHGHSRWLTDMKTLRLERPSIPSVLRITERIDMGLYQYAEVNQVARGLEEAVRRQEAVVRGLTPAQASSFEGSHARAERQRLNDKLNTYLEQHVDTLMPSRYWAPRYERLKEESLRASAAPVPASEEVVDVTTSAAEYAERMRQAHNQSMKPTNAIKP